MKRGFSLVELSIVLVILGLLTGGILAGQSLIRASELRAASTEYQRYVAAGNTFRDRYFAIPGDFRDATRFWARLNTNADCVSNSGLAVAGTPGACDGNGDGLLSTAAAASQSGEQYQFWRHLALAGLMEGSFSGLSGSGSAQHTVLGTNAPRSKLSNAGWSMQHIATPFGDTELYVLSYIFAFEFGAPVSNSRTFGRALKPEEAWNIDTKMDDGLPAQGNVIARFWNNACAAANDGTHANNDYAASYKLSDSSVQCALYFRNSF
ncbi:MAG: prepilin-type N-terminal cleavage/methylation domain-containing protein [Alphaproteobacteria bacterium]|nr:prepilin-type N-terminal cleavage/methylation domain-containing protein [Alphaproteobacteria bacterium]